MLTRKQKQEIVKNLTTEMKTAKGAVFSTFQGVSNDQIEGLRADLHQAGVRHEVVKLTLLKLALKNLGFDPEEVKANLPLAITVSQSDEVAAAQIIQKFAKDVEDWQIIGGLLDGQLIDSGQVKSLAALPAKQELQGQLVRVIAGPLQGLVGVLSGNIRQLVYALNAIREAKS